MIRKTLIASTLIAVLSLAALPAFAQEVTQSRTLTKTEDEINRSYRVTNPVRRSLSDVVVDLQDGQVVISATYTRRYAESVAVSLTLGPYIEGGRLYWEVTDAAHDGGPISDDLLEQINTHIESSWAHYWRTQAPVGHVTDVQITEDALSVTVTVTR